MQIKRILLASVAMAAIMSFAISVNAEESAGKAKDYPLVKFGDTTMKKSEIEKEIQLAMPGSPAEFSSFPAPVQENIIRNIVTQKVVFNEAKAAGFEKNDEIEQRLAQIRKQLVMDAYIQKKAKEMVSDAEIKKLYEQKSAAGSGKDELRASHILVKTEKEAKDIIAKLKKGADFAELAKTSSEDPGSKVSGGDLGFFQEGQMVKSFSDAAAKLKKDEISAPIKSEFGWHVIKLTDKRKAAAQSLEEMKPQIVSELQGKAVSNYLNQVFDKANVQLLDEKGTARKIAAIPQSAQ